MLKKDVRDLAYAGAGASERGISFAKNSESDDFNEFAFSRRPHRKQQKAPRRKNGSDEKVFEIDLKTLIIAASALLALILLIVIIVVAANSSGKDIVKENNTYVSFSKDGSYCVSVNGHTLDETFENEISLSPALDNSFAYVIEKTPDGDLVYILQRRKLTPATPSPASEILALAELAPGVVYRDGDNVNFYSSNNEDCITRNDATASNFIISDDASAIAYTLADKNNAEETKLFIYSEGGRQSYATNMCPVGISKGGKFLYAYGISSDDFVSKKLYVIETMEDKKIEIEPKFDTLKASNIKGDEIVYTVSSERGYQTKIYSAKKEKSYLVGGGICEPMLPNTIVKRSTFKDTAFENFFVPEGADRSSSASYYINKRYASTKLSTYNGKLNSEGDMFYYVDLDGKLLAVELGKKKVEPKELALGVEKFVITEKDNLYYLDESGYLWFDKETGGSKKQIETKVSSISFNSYSNILYFEIADESSIYSTEEGSGKELVEFAREEISSLPAFIDNGLKRTFVSVMNTESGLYDLYYTTTGKTFKLVEEGCNSIN